MSRSRCAVLREEGASEGDADAGAPRRLTSRGGVSAVELRCQPIALHDRGAPARVAAGRRDDGGAALTARAASVGRRSAFIKKAGRLFVPEERRRLRSAGRGYAQRTAAGRGHARRREAWRAAAAHLARRGQTTSPAGPRPARPPARPPARLPLTATPLTRSTPCRGAPSRGASPRCALGGGPGAAASRPRLGLSSGGQRRRRRSAARLPMPKTATRGAAAGRGRRRQVAVLQPAADVLQRLRRRLPAPPRQGGRPVVGRAPDARRRYGTAGHKRKRK
jgi:hypothetical protein